MSSTFDVLGTLRKKGVKLWSDQGRLHYLAPKGVLTRDEMDQLVLSRSKVVALLQRAAGAVAPEPGDGAFTPGELLPLAFSQLAHWNLYQLAERPSRVVLSHQIR